MSSRRARGRGNTRGRQQQNIRNQQMDSNGPGGRIRGTPQQVLDRYLTLARDASSSGEWVLAENLFQHAEHYTRMLSAATPPQQQPSQENQENQSGGRDDQPDGRDDGDDGRNPRAERNTRDDRNARDERNTRDERPSRQASANRDDEQQQPATASDSQSEQPPAPAGAPEWSADGQPADGEQPAAPPRRRRRSRVQRQQEEDGGDANAQADGAQADSTQADNAPTKSAGANGADGKSGDQNPVPPIDLSAAAPMPDTPEPASQSTSKADDPTPA